MDTALKELMNKQGITAHTLAKKLGGNRTKIYEITKGFSRATAPLQERIAEALNATKEDLFDEFGMARKCGE